VDSHLEVEENEVGDRYTPAECDQLKEARSSDCDGEAWIEWVSYILSIK